MLPINWILVIPAFRFDEFNGYWYYRRFGSPSANCVIPLPPVAPLPPSINNAANGFGEINVYWYYLRFGSPSANCVIPRPLDAPLPPFIVWFNP